MPLWVSDFLGDTLDLDASEVGAYMLLLMAQWRRKGKSLPDDPKKLQRIARCGRNWAKVWVTIQVYFDRDETGVYNKRLRFEAQNAAVRRQVNAQNGARGGAAKALKSNERALANATNSLRQTSTIPEPEPEPEPDKDDDDDADADGGGDAGAGARASKISGPPPPARPAPRHDPTERERLLEAMGADPVSGMVGPNGAMIGRLADMRLVQSWKTDLGLSFEEILTVVREVMAKKRGGAPMSFKYFTEEMQRYAGHRDARIIPLRPIGPSDGPDHNQPAQYFLGNPPDSLRK